MLQTEWVTAPLFDCVAVFDIRITTNLFVHHHNLWSKGPEVAATFLSKPEAMLANFGTHWFPTESMTTYRNYGKPSSKNYFVHIWGQFVHKNAKFSLSQAKGLYISGFINQQSEKNEALSMQRHKTTVQKEQ